MIKSLKEEIDSFRYEISRADKSIKENNSTLEELEALLKEEEKLEKLDQILGTVGYYDLSKSTVAKTNVLMKKGISGLKGLISGQNE